MTSPISSPQNIFAIERMSMDGDAPSWLVWFAVALPVAVAGNLLCWGLILLVYQPSKSIKEVSTLHAEGTISVSRVSRLPGRHFFSLAAGSGTASPVGHRLVGVG